MAEPIKKRLKKPKVLKRGGITKRPPRPWILPYTISVEEGTVFVVRQIRGGKRYQVWQQGLHWYVPELWHDPVATVSVVPFQLDAGPFDVTVFDGVKVGFDVKIMAAVGDVDWNWIRVKVARAKALGLWQEEVAEYDRLPLAEQTGWIKVHHPTDPISRVKYVQTDAAIIRAAVNVESIKQEVGTALRSALNDAAMLLGITSVEAKDVGKWLTRQPQPVNPSRLPIARRGATNRQELSEQSTVMAAESLKPLGVVLIEVRVQEPILPPAIAAAAERRQVAGLEKEAASDSAAAIKARWDVVKGDNLTGISHGLAAIEALRLQAAREGVELKPLINVQLGTGALVSANTQTASGGGAGKGPGGKKPGGRGGSKNRP